MLTGKTALITGGSRGIGAAIARRFAAAGADIAIVYAGRRDAAEQVCAEVRAMGRRAECYACNVADFDAAKQCVADVRAAFGGVDILVNCAGITRDGLLATMKEADFDAVVDTNLKGAFNMIRHCTGLFVRARSGRIVNISSVAGLMGNAGQTNYAASKAGLIGLTKSVARELAPRGITCNAIAPGFIRTDMTAALEEGSGLAASIPLGRMGLPDEVAQAAEYLVQADYVTGVVLRVDGGLAM